LINKGEGIPEEELIYYIQESKVLSRPLGDYGEQKGVGITAAKRLREFLGEDIVKGKGIRCDYVISAKPTKSTTTERAIPT